MVHRRVWGLPQVRWSMAIGAVSREPGQSKVGLVEDLVGIGDEGRSGAAGSTPDPAGGGLDEDCSTGIIADHGKHRQRGPTIGEQPNSGVQADPPDRGQVRETSGHIRQLEALGSKSPSNPQPEHRSSAQVTAWSRSFSD